MKKRCDRVLRHPQPIFFELSEEKADEFEPKRHTPTTTTTFHALPRHVGTTCDCDSVEPSYE